MGEPFRLSFEDLPATLPVFPLAGVLLLPRGKLPLNIFEPRYLAMFVDALATPDRLIGMIQPTEAETPDHAPRLYPLGCAGRISAFSETDDGRYLITLGGISRFAILEELPLVRGYRRMRVDFARFREDLAPEAEVSIDRDRLLNSLKAYFALNGINADWEAIGQTQDEKLITTLAMICPFQPSEKQALLECADVGERSKVMTALIEMAVFHRAGENARH